MPVIDAVLAIIAQCSKKTQPLPSEKESERKTTMFPQLRVLVAEDNLMNQKIITRHLTKRQIHVEMTANGREALQKIKAEPFNLVLMDWYIITMISSYNLVKCL
jgi:PleD family two-component response regulator